MRYLSLFSGIEAASVAWSPLNWTPVAVSEINPFACSVLGHHYPRVPNLGDVTAITRDAVAGLGPIDLVVFGFPCQDLSVAGQRKGLRDDEGNTTRSGLFFDAMRVVEWSGARWALAENVPGLLSSGGGRDFALVVGTMAGTDVDVPDGGWRNSGVVAGPRGLVEWVVLDAQFFGVPQRRRRVFLVRDSGDWRGRPPLFLERHSLQGHPAPRREAGAVVTSSLTRSLGSGGPDAARAQANHLTFQNTGQGWWNASDVATTVRTPEGGGSKEANVVAVPVHGETASCLPASSRGTGDGHGQGWNSNYLAGPMAVRRLTPVECERLQGFPDNYSLIPYRGKPAADGPRYRALGNSFAVPVVRWIGQRIQMVDDMAKKGALHDE